MFEIGSSLHEARTRQGRSFEEMEARTKVRAKYLRSLEEERFEQLPGHTYIKGFLRVYADELGLDGQLYVDEYNSRFVVGEDDHAPGLASRRHQPRGRSRRAERRESRLVAITLGLIVVATALVIAAWKFGSADEPKVNGVNTTPVKPAEVTRKRTTAAGVVVKATKGATYLEARAGSRSGRPLFRGTLERGDSQRFAVTRVYLSVAAPANVVVLRDGVRVRLPASGSLVVVDRTP